MILPRGTIGGIGSGTMGSYSGSDMSSNASASSGGFVGGFGAGTMASGLRESVGGEEWMQNLNGMHGGVGLGGLGRAPPGMALGLNFESDGMPGDGSQWQAQRQGQGREEMFLRHDMSGLPITQGLQDQLHQRLALDKHQQQQEDDASNGAYRLQRWGDNLGSRGGLDHDAGGGAAAGEQLRQLMLQAGGLSASFAPLGQQMGASELMNGLQSRGMFMGQSKGAMDGGAGPGQSSGGDGDNAPFERSDFPGISVWSGSAGLMAGGDASSNNPSGDNVYIGTGPLSSQKPQLGAMAGGKAGLGGALMSSAGSAEFSMQHDDFPSLSRFWGVDMLSGAGLSEGGGLSAPGPGSGAGQGGANGMGGGSIPPHAQYSRLKGANVNLGSGNGNGGGAAASLGKKAVGPAGGQGSGFPGGDGSGATGGLMLGGGGEDAQRREGEDGGGGSQRGSGKGEEAKLRSDGAGGPLWGSSGGFDAGGHKDGFGGDSKGGPGGDGTEAEASRGKMEGGAGLGPDGSRINGDAEEGASGRGGRGSGEGTLVGGGRDSDGSKSGDSFGLAGGKPGNELAAQQQLLRLLQQQQQLHLQGQPGASLDQILASTGLLGGVGPAGAQELSAKLNDADSRLKALHLLQQQQQEMMRKGQPLSQGQLQQLQQLQQQANDAQKDLATAAAAVAAGRGGLDGDALSKAAAAAGHMNWAAASEDAKRKMVQQQQQQQQQQQAGQLAYGAAGRGSNSGQQWGIAPGLLPRGNLDFPGSDDAGGDKGDLMGLGGGRGAPAPLPGGLAPGPPGVAGGSSGGLSLMDASKGGALGKGDGQGGVSGGADRFGLLGLLSVIRMSDPNLTTLALGTDLTTLGLNLNSTENLYKTFASPWADGPSTGDPEYSLPQCYLQPAPRLQPNNFKKFQLETLFYIFYSMPRDEAQLLAALELYNRGWYFHREGKWVARVPGTEPVVKTPAFERGSFFIFEPALWERVRKDGHTLQYADLEMRPLMA
eukprot:jgi/Mesvir1/951/Mv17505-RA.1